MDWMDTGNSFLLGSGGLYSRHTPRTSLARTYLADIILGHPWIIPGNNCFQEFLHLPRTSFLEAPPGGHFLQTFCHKHQHSWSRFLPWGENAKSSFHQPDTIPVYTWFPAAPVSQVRTAIESSNFLPHRFLFLTLHLLSPLLFSGCVLLFWQSPVRQNVTLKLSILLESSVDQFEYLIPLYRKLVINSLTQKHVFGQIIMFQHRTKLNWDWNCNLYAYQFIDDVCYVWYDYRH